MSGIHSSPKHIAIIMDGNARWAQSKGKSIAAGHKHGAETLKRLVEHCATIDLEYLTVYAFSSENWNRDASEVSDLMELLRYYLGHEVKRLHKNNIRIRFIGDRSRLEEDICRQLAETEALTASNTGPTLIIALSYGSREELVRAMRTVAQRHADNPDAISESTIEEALDTFDIPDPDLLIRTGGDQRLSNFLLWQCAYTELIFTSTLWPDFSPTDLDEAIHVYQQRERRFGSRISAAAS